MPVEELAGCPPTPDDEDFDAEVLERLDELVPPASAGAVDEPQFAFAPTTPVSVSPSNTAPAVR